MTSAALAIPAAKRVDAGERLIVALDFPTVDDAQRLVEELGDHVSFYKIGLHLQLAQGLFDFANKLITQKKKIFLDFKYIDICDTMKGVISRASDMGIQFVTVYQSPLAIEAALAVRKDNRPKILTVTLLTDRDQKYIEEEFNVKMTVPEFVVKKAKMVKQTNGDGVICSPNEVREIRSAIDDPNFLVVTPGIRPNWDSSNGHKRAGTPYDATVAGANYLVVGRPIIRANDRLGAACRIIDEMQTGFDQRGV